MTIQGVIKNGHVEFDHPLIFPEGTKVTCELNPLDLPSELETAAAATKADAPPYHAELLKFAGVISDMPPDISVNIDHYLYGHPKK